MSNKALEVGDTVIIRGVVVKTDRTRDMVNIKTNDDCFTPLLYVSAIRISEIIPKPWEPKVGEPARYYPDYSSVTTSATVLAIAEGHAMLRFSDNSVGTTRVSSLSSPVPFAA